MARYFFHLRDGRDHLLDPDGLECRDFDEATAKALRAARDIIGEDARRGEIDLRYRIEVENESGHVLHTLHFSEAVKIVTG